MISRDTILANEIIRYVSYFKEANKLFTINAFLTPAEKQLLPPEAIVNGVLVADFENWTLTQITIDDTNFSCILVYSDGEGGFIEYPITFPITQILFISEIPDSIESVATSENVTTNIGPEQKKRSYLAMKMISGKTIKHEIKSNK